MIQKITTSYGKATVYRNTPTGADKIILIIPGYSESITHNKELVERLAKKGYDIITYNQPRGDTFADPIARQGTIALEILEAMVPKDQKVLAVSHSLGAAASLRAAKESPDWFAGLILMQPSGIGDKQTFPELIRRVGLKTAKNHTEAGPKSSIQGATVQSVSLQQILRAHTSSTAYIARNPLLALREAKAAVEYVIANDIAEVQRLGVPVSTILVHNDELFSMKDSLHYDKVIAMPGSYTTLTLKAAKHDTFWMHPEQTAEIVDGLARQDLV